MALQARIFACITGWIALAAATWLALGRPGIAAQTYPQRTVRIIVPFTPGGTADLVARIVGDWLSRKWGHPVLIENKPGAGGNVGAEAVFRAEPDGYTLLSSPPPLVINQNLYPKLGFDPAAFVPVSVMGLIPNALVVSPRKVAATTVAGFIADARSDPGKTSAATQGNGTTSHLTAAMFQMMAKVKFVLVPYRGSAPALQGLLAGDCDIMFDNLGVSLPLAKAGGLKLLAVGTAHRMASLPDVPTIAETLPGFSSVTWMGIAAPPRDIVSKVSADVAEAIRSHEVRARFDELSAEPVGTDSDATARFMADANQRSHRRLCEEGKSWSPTRLARCDCPG
jgi:tripartite-type tricarboxylate transporter receptor subunit TctC